MKKVNTSQRSYLSRTAFVMGFSLFVSLPATKTPPPVTKMDFQPSQRYTAKTRRYALDTKEQIEYWLELAAYDFGTAKAMQRACKYLYVGFMCQQVIEKALKAVIAKTGAVPPKTHDLQKLAELTDLAKYMNEKQEDLLKELSPLNTETRYRSYKELVARGLNKHICREYIIQTEEMLKWIKEKLSH